MVENRSLVYPNIGIRRFGTILCIRTYVKVPNTEYYTSLHRNFFNNFDRDLAIETFSNDLIRQRVGSYEDYELNFKDCKFRFHLEKEIPQSDDTEDTINLEENDTNN